MALHPELQRIEQQYFALAEDLRMGHISEQDALSVIGNLRAVDGEGALWSIDPYSGEFVRAMPGEEPYPADPARFAPAQLPPVETSILPHGAHPSMVSEFQHPALRPLPPEPRAQKAKSALAGALSGLGGAAGKLASPLGSLLGKHLRTVLMVLAFVAVAFVMISRSPDADNTDPQVTPEVTAPVSIPDIVLPGEEPAPAPLAPEKIAAIVETLRSGDTKALDELLTDDPAARLGLTPLLGAARLGLAFTPGEPVTASDGTVTLPVKIGDPAAPTASWVLVISAEGEVLSGSSS